MSLSMNLQQTNEKTTAKHEEMAHKLNGYTIWTMLEEKKIWKELP